MLLILTSIGLLSIGQVFSQSTNNIETETSLTLISNMRNDTSTLKGSPEEENIISPDPIMDVVPGQPIKILNNSFIVELKPVEVGTLQDTVSKLTSNIESYDGNVSGIYENFNSFNIKFEETGNISGSEADNVSLSGAEQFLQNLKDDRNVTNIYPDASVTIN